jgi:hypothetical protein
MGRMMNLAMKEPEVDLDGAREGAAVPHRPVVLELRPTLIGSASPPAEDQVFQTWYAYRIRSTFFVRPDRHSCADSRDLLAF